MASLKGFKRPFLCFMTTFVVLFSGYAECCRSSVNPPPKPHPMPLAAPTINDTKMHYPDILTVFWDPIPKNQIEKGHPILGYKVSLWLDNRVRTTAFRPGYEYRPNKVHNRVPETTPTIQTVGPTQTHVNFTKIVPNAVYQLRVNAYNDIGDGSYSLPHTFRLLESIEERKEREDEEFKALLEKGGL